MGLHLIQSLVNIIINVKSIRMFVYTKTFQLSLLSTALDKA